MTDYTSREYADAELDHAERMEKKRAEIKAREIVALVDSIGVGTDDLVLYKCNLVTAITQALLEFSQGSTVGSFEKDAEDLMWKAAADYHDNKICDSLGIPPPRVVVPESVSDAEIESACIEYSPSDAIGDERRAFEAGYRAALERVK